jgi:hypothetical protein
VQMPKSVAETPLRKCSRRSFEAVNSAGQLIVKRLGAAAAKFMSPAPRRAAPTHKMKF